MTDVQAIKDAMATARQEIRDRVVRALRENGTATTSALAPGDVMFHLTRAGAEQALQPGDVLNPEDWP